MGTFNGRQGDEDDDDDSLERMMDGVGTFCKRAIKNKLCWDRNGKDNNFNVNRKFSFLSTKSVAIFIKLNGVVGMSSTSQFFFFFNEIDFIFMRKFPVLMKSLGFRRSFPFYFIEKFRCIVKYLSTCQTNNCLKKFRFNSV